jgi:glycosyltransferase involved in cell wall biosynthesis
VKVMFDSQIFCSQRVGGISRYVASIAAEMAKMDSMRALIVAPFHYNEYLQGLPRSLVYGRKIAWLEHLKVAAYAASALPSNIVRRRFRPDILHNTYYYPVGRAGGVRRIVTVHDLIHEKYPADLTASASIIRWKSACIERADHVICVSENTRRDVLDTYRIDEDRVSVTHLGCESLMDRLSDEPADAFRARVLGADCPYVLYVGSRVGYKNFDGLLRGFASSTWLRANVFLVCFGGGKFTDSERAAMSQAGVSERVKYVGGSDSVLASCYAHASLFVYPTHYEGFGLPPLEAMSLDCPVACSGTGSIPEVVGDAAMIFDPSEPASIRAALEGVLMSASLAATLVERGRARRLLFSWQKCAEKTVGIYASVLGS